MVRFKPKGGYYLVVLLKPENKKKGHIFLPETAPQPNILVKIVEIYAPFMSNNQSYEPKYVIGATVVLEQFGGRVVELNGKEYLAVSENDILGEIFEVENV